MINMPIANFFIQKILKAYRALNHYDEDDIDLIRYSLEGLLGEIEKFVYMTVIFISLGYGWHFFACSVAVLSIRPLAGGFHAKTAWRCFWWTISGFALAILVLPLVPITSTIILLIAVFSVVATYIASPFRSDQIERIAKKDKDKLRKNTVTILTVIWFVVLFVHQDHFLATSTIWIIFLQNLQLIISWIKRKTQKKPSH